MTMQTAELLIKKLSTCHDEQAMAMIQAIKALNKTCIVAGKITDDDGEFTVKLQCRTQDGSTFYVTSDME